MKSSLKFFYHAASANARAVLATAELAAIPLELVALDVKSGEHRSPQYLALNPNGLFPTLVHGDFSLWETVAILQYIASIGRDNTLFPTSPARQADICRWQCWNIAHWTPALRPFIYENIIKRLRGRGEPDPNLIAAGYEGFAKFSTILDSALSCQPYLCGDGLTLADISVGSHLLYAKQASIPIEVFPNIAAWYSRLGSLPEWQRVQAMPVSF